VKAISTLIAEVWESAYSYPQYLQKIAEDRALGKATGGQSSDDYLRYTDLNLRRKQRWAKTYRPDPAAVEAAARPQSAENWLVISEGWCGDAAHSLPIMDQLAAVLPQVLAMRVVLRDQNLDLMDRFLTNGGRSIPKLIRFEPSNIAVLGTWGPRPAEAQALRAQLIENPEPGRSVGEHLQLWYSKDKGKSIEKELLHAFSP
jgi:hypothetical protein